MYGPRPAARLCNEKMALVWSRTAMVPSGWAESRPFPRLFEHRVRSLCACERLRTVAVVSYLSFLLFSVVVVGFSCFQTWEMLGHVKKMDLGVAANFSLRRARSAWHSPREGSIVSRQLHVLRQNRRECRWRIKLPSNPLELESLCTASCAAVATVEWKIFTAVIVGLHRDNDLTGRVDHAQCMLHAACARMRRPSHSMDTDRLNLLKERPVGERRWDWTGQKDEKNTTSFHQNATKSRDDTFS